jgi:hypothetical protein
MQLFTYFQRQPQWYSKVSNLIGNIYHGLMIGNRVKSVKYFKTKLYDFDHSIRYSFGLTNYEEMRNYFHHKFSKVDNYTAPKEWLIPSKMKEILNLGMINTSKNLVSHINNQLSKAETACEKDLLNSWPLIHGYTNHINNLENLIVKINNNFQFNLIDIIKELNLQTLDKVLKIERNPKILVHFDKVWKNSFNLYTKELNDQLIVREAPKTMASQMWGFAAKKQFFVATTKTIGFKTWNEVLYSDVKYLNSSLHRICEVKTNYNYRDMRKDFWVNQSPYSKILKFN